MTDSPEIIPTLMVLTEFDGKMENKHFSTLIYGEWI